MRFVEIGRIVYDAKGDTIARIIDPDSVEGWLDPAIQSRWLSVDPIEHHSQSPYVGIGNNPIYFIDPDGQDIEPRNAAAKTLISDVVLKVFNSSDVFYFDSKHKTLQFNKKAYKKASQGWTDDQKILADQFRQVVESKDYHLWVYGATTIGEKISDKIEITRSTWIDTPNGPALKSEVLEPLTFSKESEFGMTMVFGGTKIAPEFTKYGVVDINTAGLQNLPEDIQTAEGVKEFGASETLFHEIIDHFLQYMNTGNLDPKYPEDRKKEVEAYNRTARIVKTKERTGDAHTK